MIDLNKILWGIATLFLLYGSVYFSVHTGFIQFKFKDMIKGFKTKEKNNISPFKALMMTLAARIGVGSLAGVALSIYMGGIGTIFWIWVTTLFVSTNAYAESVLGLAYKKKYKNEYYGGPSFYIRDGLGYKNLAKFYAILIIFAYLIGFLTIQANTIAISINQVLNFDLLIIGIVLAIVTFMSILNGVKSIANITSKLVPIMGILYLALSIFVIATKIDIVPEILLNIIKDAFNPQSIKYGILSSIIIGIERAIFATEAGLGSGAIAASASDGNNIKGQGMIQILGIYFTSFIICTSTALLIITSDYKGLSFKNFNGIELTQYAFNFHLGTLGNILLPIIIIFFAFSTILTGYYYGESSLKFLNKNINKKHLLVLKIVLCILLIIGSVAKASILWKIVDTLVAIMAIINMFAVLSLKKEVIEITKQK